MDLPSLSFDNLGPYSDSDPASLDSTNVQGWMGEASFSYLTSVANIEAQAFFDTEAVKTIDVVSMLSEEQRTELYQEVSLYWNKHNKAQQLNSEAGEQEAVTLLDFVTNRFKDHPKIWSQLSSKIRRDANKSLLLAEREATSGATQRDLNTQIMQRLDQLAWQIHELKVQNNEILEKLQWTQMSQMPPTGSKGSQPSSRRPEPTFTPVSSDRQQRRLHQLCRLLATRVVSPDMIKVTSAFYAPLNGGEDSDWLEAHPAPVYEKDRKTLMTSSGVVFQGITSSAVDVGYLNLDLSSCVWTETWSKPSGPGAMLVGYAETDIGVVAPISFLVSDELHSTLPVEQTDKRSICVNFKLGAHSMAALVRVHLFIIASANNRIITSARVDFYHSTQEQLKQKGSDNNE